MTFNELVIYMETYRRSHPEQRVGQAYFNALHQHFPQVADAIRGTDNDPFYRDDRLHAFFYAVGQEVD